MSPLGFLIAIVPSESSIGERPFICDWLARLLVAVPSPWRRVGALSAAESGRLSAAAAGSKLTDSLGVSNRHFGVRELRVGSCGERGEKLRDGGRGERLRGGSYGEGAMGEDGREGERIKTWGSSEHQAAESPPILSGREARAVGLVVVRCKDDQPVKRTAIKPISYLNTLLRQGGGGLKETDPIWILHINAKERLKS